jgi:hypothetical protein
MSFQLVLTCRTEQRIGAGREADPARGGLTFRYPRSPVVFVSDIFVCAKGSDVTESADCPNIVACAFFSRDKISGE